MRKSIIVVENFYDDPMAVRNYALSQRYYYPWDADAAVHSGEMKFIWMASWFKSARDCPFKSSESLIGKLEAITGEQIDREHWNLDFPITGEGKASDARYTMRTSCFWNCCFHFKPDVNQEIGGGVHNHVEDDWNGVDESGWAGLIYLTPDAPLEAGLRLWRNRDPTRNYDWMTPKEDWEMIDAFGNVFNRLILCRGNLPHSGGNGWGDVIETGRLFQTFFFKVRQSPVTQGVAVPLPT